MASKALDINALPTASELNNADYLILEQGGITKKIAISDFAILLTSKLDILSDTDIDTIFTQAEEG